MWNGSTFLAPAYPDCPGKEAVKWVSEFRLALTVQLRRMLQTVPGEFTRGPRRQPAFQGGGRSRRRQRRFLAVVQRLSVSYAERGEAAAGW